LVVSFSLVITSALLNQTPPKTPTKPAKNATPTHAAGESVHFNATIFE